MLFRRTINRALSTILTVAFLAMSAACSTVSERPPALPDSFWGFNLNGGRTQAISVNPRNRDEVVIATQFGGLWRTTDGGARWRHLNGLNEVFVHDVQFGPDGATLVATVGRNNYEDHRGGIWVSRDNGATWSRPSSSRLPASTRIPDRPVAYGVAVDPDDGRRWYAGTDYGVARSADNGATWTHVEVDGGIVVEGDKRQQAVQAVLPFPGGSILAMTRRGVYRSDSRGAAGSWTRVRNEGFGFYENIGWNKMDRSPYWPYAFILKDYTTLYLYELGSGNWTAIPLPAGAGSRGPFVRVGKPSFSGGYITIWVGQGTRALRVTRKRIGSLRVIAADDWTIFGRGEGVHDDMGDLGLDAEYRPVMIGSDGGVYKPDPEDAARWINAAPAGSGMNSYLITDLAGVNVEDDGVVTTSLHYATQDNAVWGSLDNGASWPNVDCCEGFHIEGPRTASTGADVTMAYGRVGAGYSGSRMSDQGLADQTNVSDAIAGGGTLQSQFCDTATPPNCEMKFDAGQAFYLKPGYWLRVRGPSGANQQVLISTDDGATWRQRFDLAVNAAGVFQRTKAHYPASYAKAYLPVFTGAANPDGSMKIGLLRLYSLTRNTVTPLGASAVIELPSNGSLGQRATEFDWQAVFGAHPKQWRWVIAPDIVNGDVKVTRDGGRSWTTDAELTSLVTKNGALRLWDGGAYSMQVTHIAFDPYREDRVLVGTREAGVICSNDGGASWGRVPKSERILYVTGFQFKPGGSVIVSTYGRGLWSLKAKAAACVGGRPPRESSSSVATGTVAVIPRESIPIGVLDTDVAGAVGLSDAIEPDEEERSEPPPVDPDRPRLVVTTSVFTQGGPVLGDDERIEITAYGFAPEGIEVTLDDKPINVKGSISRIDKGVRIALDMPAELGYGAHRITVAQRVGGEERRAAIEFRKVHRDEHLGEPEDKDKGARELSPQELEALETQYDAPEIPLKPSGREQQRIEDDKR
jgi:photosystem II stability/assembly factor-like uncharacterized protein